MRLLSLLLLILITSCASYEADRSIASIKIEHIAGDIDFSKSLVQLFPSGNKEGSLKYYFYLQIRNHHGDYVDCFQEDITLKTHKGQKVPFHFERLLPGRYFISFEKIATASSHQVHFYIKGKQLREQFKLHRKYPDKAHTKIKIMENENNRIVFHLRLADKDNRPVEVPDRPEVIIDGTGFLEEIRYVSEGVWEFAFIYPDENQIMYINVRTMGMYFEKLFRYQHVDKKPQVYP